jgi:hypothetical protein
MTTFDRRENAFEAEFAHRSELEFKARERALTLLALWAAERLGKPAEAGKAYAQDIVAMDVESSNPDAVLARIVKDLSARGVGEADVRKAMDRFRAQAEAAIRDRAS